MNLHLKYEFARLKLFIFVSFLLGFALCTLQFLDIFLIFDTLLISPAFPERFTPLPTVVMVFIIMFHTLLPGLVIAERGASRGILYIVAVWGFYIILAYSYATGFSTYVPLIAPMLGCWISTVRVLAWEESFLQQENEGIRKTFCCYLEPSVADKVLKNPGMHTQDGVRKNVTIMFTDLRGFTRLCEDIEAEQVIRMLRDCFSELITIARAHGGTVDKLIGDSMMVVWGDPEPLPDHAERSVQAAIDMQDAMRQLKKRWRHELGVNIRLGIGINTAEVVVGTIGSEEFCDYTVLGSGVNLAARLESACPANCILVSEATHAIVHDRFVFGAPVSLQPKPGSEDITAYCVLSPDKTRQAEVAQMTGAHPPLLAASQTSAVR